MYALGFGIVASLHGSRAWELHSYISICLPIMYCLCIVNCAGSNPGRVNYVFVSNCLLDGKELVSIKRLIFSVLTPLI